MDRKKYEFKQSLKQDEFKSGIHHVIEYFQDPAKLNKFLNYVIGALLVALVVWGYTAYRNNVDSQVYKSIASAMQKLQAKDYDTAINNFKTIARDYPNSSHVGLVNYRLGQCYELKNDLDMALKAYGEAVNSYLPEEVLPAAYMSYANALETKGDYAKAVETYDRLLKKMPKYFAAGEVMLDQARNLRLENKNDEAAAKYKAVIEKFPDSTWANTAKQYAQ